MVCFDFFPVFLGLLLLLLFGRVGQRGRERERTTRGLLCKGERRRLTPTTDSPLGIPQPVAATGAQRHDPGADERRLIIILINILNVAPVANLVGYDSTNLLPFVSYSTLLFILQAQSTDLTYYLCLPHINTWIDSTSNVVAAVLYLLT